MSTNGHHCAVCDVPIGPSFLMCAGHWHLVPRELKTRVYRTWGALQRHKGGAASGKPLLKAYTDARAEAIATVNERLNPPEGGPTDGHEDHDAA